MSEYPQIQTTEDKNAWSIFPDDLNSGTFKGFENRPEISQNRGAFVLGENVKFGGICLPSLRDGYSAIGTEDTGTAPVMRAWVFETRDGVQYELKVVDTKIYYWMVGRSTEWTVLLSGLTANTEWFFANIGKTANATTHCLFSNGVDGVFKWSGAYAEVLAATANTIQKTGGTFWTAGGFDAATASVNVNGSPYQYTGGEGTDTLTTVTPDPLAAGVLPGMLAVQLPVAVAALGSVQGSVGCAHDGRLHMRLETKKSVWDYSKLDDPFDFTAAASDGAGWAKEIEMAGPIMTYGKLNKAILCFKKRLIKMLTFGASSTRIDVPTYSTLISTDDKGTTLGAINQKSTFSTPKGLVFVTPDKRLALLTGVTANNEPQYLMLSDPIQPVFDQGDFSDAAGICVNNILWLSFKSSTGVGSNDTVLRGDMTRVSYDSNGQALPIRWDVPYVGWNVNDWTAVFDSVNGRYDVHFHSSLNGSTYKVNYDDKTDNGNGFGSTVRTWAEHFGYPQWQKRMDESFVEIRMKENANITATLLYDEDGVTQRQEYILSGDAAEQRFDSTTYNPIGATPFGSTQMGSQIADNEYDTYRFNLEINPNVYFFNISLQLSSDGDGQDYELVRFGYCIAEVKKDTDRKYLIKAN